MACVLAGRLASDVDVARGGRRLVVADEPERREVAEGDEAAVAPAADRANDEPRAGEAVRGRDLGHRSAHVDVAGAAGLSSSPMSSMLP